MTSAKFDCDVVIAGGGLVGLATAASLGRRGFQVELIDRGEFLQNEPSDLGLRVSAISPGSQKLLHDVGAWSSCLEPAAAPYHKMCVWDADDTAYSERALRFHAADLGEIELGHIVFNQSLSWALVSLLQEMETVKLSPKSSLAEVKVDQSSRRLGTAVRVSCDRKERLCRLLVGADGARSSVRQLTQIETINHSYQQRGIVCTVSSSMAHEHTAWQRFLPSGPLALLPLSDPHQSSIVWSIASEQADELCSLDQKEFGRRLSDASDHVLGELTVMSDIASFPLSMQRATRYVKEGVALVGDAAHVIHPLAGQGVNLGFADVATLTHSLEAARTRGDNLGDLYALRQYERSRKLANRKMQWATHGLQHLFGHSNSVVSGMRSLGLSWVNSIGHIKHQLARQALL